MNGYTFRRQLGRCGPRLGGGLTLLVMALGLIHGPAQSFVGGPGRPAMPPGLMPPDSAASPAAANAGSGPKNPGGGPWVPSEPLPDPAGTNASATNAIQMSLQGANVDMVAQWLAQTTGKTVIKHPRVQCQLTIMSSKKISPREAVNMVYRALALEGYSAVELNNSILIVPEGQEPRMSPEVVAGALTNVPAGRQLLVKVFPLKHIAAADLKDRLRTALSDKATIDVDERANQIIVTDYNDNLRVAGELIEALDNDTPEDVAVRLIPLKNIAADQLAKEMQPLYQKFGGKSGNKSTIDVAADDRSNSLLVLCNLADFYGIQKLVTLLDTEDAQEKTLQTFILKNADAQDVAKQLQDLNQNQNNGGSRFNYYFSAPRDADTKKLSVVADRRRNAVIVQAPPAQMAGIAKMITELDEPVAAESLAPRIYKLKYVSAVDIEAVLNELFLKKVQQRSYWDFFNDNPGSTEDRDVGRLYGKVRITSEPYANAIIVTANSKENLAVIENVLAQLDSPSESGDSTMRIGLKYAKSDTVANSLNILFARNGSPALRPVPPQSPTTGAQPYQQTSQTMPPQSNFELEREAKVDGYYPWLGGQPDTGRPSDDKNSIRPVSDLVGRVRCVGDLRGNAVLISANVHFFPQILKLIEELDAPSDKVSIEARIVEVSSDFLDRMGVRWSPDGSQVFTKEDYNNSIIASTSGKYQQGFGGKTTVNTPENPSSDIVQTLASLRSGVVASTINIDYLVQFMRQNTDAAVLGEPSITIDDNELGRLFVGQQVPVPNTTQVSSAGSQNTSFTYKDVGVVLEVTPHINREGDVQLKIHTESSTVVPGDVVLGGSVFDTRNFHTDVTAQNGQTLVIGGIIQKQTSEINYKTPFFGSIPGLGYLFKKKDKTTREVELMVFLKPTVVHTAADARDLQKQINAKTPLLNKWREDSTAQPKGQID